MNNEVTAKVTEYKNNIKINILNTHLTDICKELKTFRVNTESIKSIAIYEALNEMRSDILSQIDRLSKIEI